MEKLGTASFFVYIPSNCSYRKFYTKDDGTKKQHIGISWIMCRYNWSQFLTVREWDTYKRSIQNAWEYRDNAIRSNKRHMKVIYICGTGRCGKSTLARQIAESKGYSYANSGSSKDRMQPYSGQDAYVLDDIRIDFAVALPNTPDIP